MALVDKARAIEELKAKLQEQLEQATQSHRLTHEGVTHEESRPENDKDTRALEASYLARGQAQRVAELMEELARVASMSARVVAPTTPAALGCLVEVETDHGCLWYFVAPAGGGLKLEVDAVSITVVTHDSPVGRALLGRREGDDVHIKTPQGVRDGSVVSVL